MFSDTELKSNQAMFVIGLTRDDGPTAQRAHLYLFRCLCHDSLWDYIAWHYIQIFEQVAIFLCSHHADVVQQNFLLAWILFEILLQRFVAN